MLLDPDGKPLSDETKVDVVDSLVSMFDQRPDDWSKLEAQFDEQLTLARGHVGKIVEVANGEANINMDDKLGGIIGRLLADIVVKALVLKVRNDRGFT